MQKLALSVILCLCVTFSNAQNFAVKSFQQLEKDMEARFNPVIDQNGDKCALIKVVSTENGFEFHGGAIGIMKVEQKTAEYWVYVPRGSKAITIKHPKLGILRNYLFPIPILESTVYEMVLINGSIETVVKPIEIATQWLVIETEPSGADVFINNQQVGKTPYQNELPSGKYIWRVKKELFFESTGIANLNADSAKCMVNITLKPNHGNLYITSVPEAGADVTFDGISMGVTPCQLNKMPVGEHTITLTKDFYATKSQQVNVVAGELTTVDIEMEPTFTEVNISTNPSSQIFVNEQYVGEGLWNGRLNPGVYTFKASCPNHADVIQKHIVTLDKPLAIVLEPTPVYGSLTVISIPVSATINIDGKEYGTTPYTIKNLPAGSHTLTLSKNGCATSVQNVTIEHDKTTTVNQTLLTGCEVSITSSPRQVDLYIDKEHVGTTPFSGTLGYGTHQLSLVSGKYRIDETIVVNQKDKNSWHFDVYEESTLFVNPQSVTCGGGSGTFDLYVKSNTDWEIFKKPDWCHISKKSNNNIEFKYEKNTDSERIGYIYFRTKNLAKSTSIAVVQRKNADLKLFESGLRFDVLTNINIGKTDYGIRTGLYLGTTTIIGFETGLLYNYITPGDYFSDYYDYCSVPLCLKFRLAKTRSNSFMLYFLAGYQYDYLNEDYTNESNKMYELRFQFRKIGLSFGYQNLDEKDLDFLRIGLNANF